MLLGTWVEVWTTGSFEEWCSRTLRGTRPLRGAASLSILEVPGAPFDEEPRVMGKLIDNG